MTWHNINVQNPWFTYIASGEKTVEGRLNTSKFASLRIGDSIRFINNDQKVCVKIVDIQKYKTFEEYLSQEGLKRTLPNIKTIEKGIAVYRQFYSEDKEREFGICAIHIKKTKCYL